MTAAERAFLLKVQRRAAQFSPELSSALASSYARIRAQLGDSAIGRFIARGDVEGLIAALLSMKLLERAFYGVALRLRRTVESSARLTVPDLPPTRGTRAIATAFDWLNPNVAAAVKKFEIDIISKLSTDVQDVVRKLLNDSISRGVNGVELGRQLRSVIGLSPNQESYIENFRRSLAGEPGYGSPFDRVLRDRRHDARIKAALEGGKPLTPAEIEKFTQDYRRGWVNRNAETWGRTLSRNALRVGQRSTWDQAIERGDLSEEEIEKTWIHYDPQPDPRPHHQAMHGETVAFRQNYSNGDSYAGEHDSWNCHCVDVYQITPKLRSGTRVPNPQTGRALVGASEF